MSDGMETYRAYLSAQKLAEALLAAHYDKASRTYYLTDASREVTEAQDRIDTAILCNIAPSPVDVPA